MSENIKHKLDPRLEVAFLYLKRFCAENSVRFKRKFVQITGGKTIIICGSPNGTYASLGVDKNDKMRIFMQDQKIKRWAELEGFTTEDMYDKLKDELIKEATLVELATALIS